MPVRVTGIVGLEVTLEVGRVVEDGALTFAILAFNYEVAGQRKTFATVGGQAVTVSTTNYVFIDHTGALNVSTTGYPENTHIRLARVITNADRITDILDDRVILAAGLDNEVQKEVENSQSSTTGDWQQKIRLSLTDLPEGTYIIQWYCELRHSNGTLAEYAQMRVEADDLTELGTAVWPYNIWEDSGGFTAVDLAAGSHTIDLDFRVQGAGTAYVRRARLLLWRIA